MSADRKQRLVERGADVLADTLLKLAEHNQDADKAVERLVATPEENRERCRAQIRTLRRSRRFVRWRATHELARQLTALLDDIRAAADGDATVGIELVAAFFQTDTKTLGRCDDSSGVVGNVYRHDARDLFAEFARHHPDSAALTKLLIRLNRDDEFGVRRALVDAASSYLPESCLRRLVDVFRDAAGSETDEYARRQRLYCAASVARQLGDAPLFAAINLEIWQPPPMSTCLDIARLYLESGDAETALVWVNKDVPDSWALHDKRDLLLLDIHGRLGNAQQQEDIAWRMFRRHRSKDTLETLLSVVGADQKESIIAAQTEQILADARFSAQDAEFLVAMERPAEAERYIVARARTIDGDEYTGLRPLAKALEAAGFTLGATVLYRALLDALLADGQYRLYDRGVRYLRRLDQLAETIRDWRSLDSHTVYTEQLRRRHGRKTSFWSRYGT